MPHARKIAVIGLGYVGLPVAVAFARAGAPVIGFDIGATRVAELRAGHDRTREVESADLAQPTLEYTDDATRLRAADFHIVTVPTPIDEARMPDLSAMLSASEIVGDALKRGDIVVYESTVYPGAVEEDCVPVLEKASGLKGGIDFTVGYSPERINPGDKQHRFETITKVVSAQDPATLDIVANVYGSVVKAGIHRAPSIKVAEAAKVIENTQRDLNIAFMNELSAIFHQLGIDTGDVLAAAATKWNFMKFQPGLVGGHCIGVDPYYLTYRAEKAGYRPEIILAGRRINDDMGQRVARECLRGLEQRNCADPLVTVLGMTFKEDVPDIRNSKVIDVVRELNRAGARTQVHDPFALADETQSGIRRDADAARPTAAGRRGHPCRRARNLRGRRLAADRAAAQGWQRGRARREMQARSRTKAGRHRPVAPVNPILVTGAAGFIGFHVARRLVDIGRAVVGVDNLSPYYDPALKQARLKQLAGAKNFKFVKLDLADRAATAALFAAYRFPLVIHLAAQAGVRHSLVDPHAYVDANLTGFVNVLEGCRHHGCRHLLYASSSSVYGSNTKMPFRTSDNVDHPLSLYGASKKANELMAHSYSHLFALPTTGLRFFTVYGPWGRPDMAMWIFAEAIDAGKPIRLFNHGKMRRDFTYIDDVVQAVVRLIDKPATPDPNWSSDEPDPASSSAPWRIYNIGNNNPVELLDVVALLEQALGKKAIRELTPMQPGDVPATYADVEDLMRDAGFKPSTPIGEGVVRFIDWYRSYHRP